MIDIIQMPQQSRSFAPVLDSIELRCSSYQNKSSWIGQSEHRFGGLEECDRGECYHIVNQDVIRTIGYARLKPLTKYDESDDISQRILELAQQHNKMPAFELQRVSVREFSEDDPDRHDQIKVLRELITEALRIANFNQSRFIYTSCDRGGTAALRKTGVRYSVLSTPFSADGRQMVILYIPVTNKNILALNPLKLVGGTGVSDTTKARDPTRCPVVNTPSIFGKMEGLASIKDH